MLTLAAYLFISSAQRAYFSCQRLHSASGKDLTGLKLPGPAVLGLEVCDGDHAHAVAS